MNPTEFDLLFMYVEKMEAEGKNRNLIRIGIDQALVEQFSEKGFATTLEHLQKLADICLAREWLEHKVMGGKYAELGLTATGQGIVRSRQQRDLQLASRTRLKRISDYIENHKGLLVVLGSAIALAGLLIKLLGD